MENINMSDFSLLNNNESLNFSELPIISKHISPSHFLLSSNNSQAFFRHTNITTGIFVAGYVFVFILGLIGNICVIAVVIRIRKMRTVMNFFISNLAFADILVTLFCIPATLASNIITPWILGLVLCKAVAYLQGVSVCASVNTLVAISIDRFLAICYPMQCQISSRGCRFIIAAIWIFSFTITLPWTVYFRLIPLGKTSDDEILYICREIWPTERMRIIYFIIAHFLLCYLLPLFIIFLCYVLIWVKVWRREMPGEGMHNNNVIHRSKIKVIKMIFIVVLAFMISWLPLYVIFIRMNVGEPYQEGSLEQFVIEVSAPIAQWLGASNSCINPILYAFFNNKFRTGFKSVLFGSNSCCKPKEDSMRMTSGRGRTAASMKTRTINSERKCSYI